MALTIDQIETALIKSGGFVSQTAKMLNVSGSNIYDRIKRSEYLQKRKREIDEKYLDLAESKLMSQINEENLGAICFYLKCKGKGRGYVEKQQVDHSSSDGSMSPPTKIVIEAANDDGKD